MQYSTPIFIGGIIRWMVDGYAARQAKARAAAAAPHAAASQAEAEVKAIAESETSPGMLLASGLIAGGSLGGMVAAFMEFLPEFIKDRIDFTDPMKDFFAKMFGEEGGLVQQVLALVLFL